jgi:DNA-binding IclR family transcriptional regulator
MLQLKSTQQLTPGRSPADQQKRIYQDLQQLSAALEVLQTAVGVTNNQDLQQQITSLQSTVTQLAADVTTLMNAGYLTQNDGDARYVLKNP